MLVRQIQALLDAQVLTGLHHMDREVYCACGADLMSDVLALVKEDTALLTGLVNPQVIRTAEMLDVSCIVFVRGKLPSDEILDMAKMQDIVVLSTEKTLYAACGVLYSHGLPGPARKTQ